MKLYGNDAKLSFKHLAKCVLQLSMPISRQVQKLIHIDDCACLLDNLQFMLVMCITSFIQKAIKLLTVMMFKCQLNFGRRTIKSHQKTALNTSLILWKELMNPIMKMTKSCLDTPSIEGSAEEDKDPEVEDDKSSHLPHEVKESKFLHDLAQISIKQK